MFDWLNSNAGAIQALLTGVLILATLWYAHITSRALELSRQQFARNWEVDYYFAVERYDQPTKTDEIRYFYPVTLRQADAVVTVANLGRPALLVQGVRLWLADPLSKAKAYRIIPVTVAHGETKRFIIADFVVYHLIEAEEIPSHVPPEEQNWKGEFGIALLLYVEGKEQSSKPQAYTVEIRYRAVQSLERLSPDLEALVTAIPSLDAEP